MGDENYCESCAENQKSERLKAGEKIHWERASQVNVPSHGHFTRESREQAEWHANRVQSCIRMFLTLWRRMNPSDWHFLHSRAFARSAKSIANKTQAEKMGAFE